MRVLQLISSGGMYGAEKMLIGLTRSLAELDCQTVTCVFDNRHVGSQVTIDALKAEGLTIEAVTCGGKIDLSAVRAIRNHINKHDIDVVHTHGYKADIYGFAAAHKRRTPIVATSHYWTRRTTALRFYAYCDQLVLRHFDGVVAVSRDIASEMVASGTPAERVQTIDNGIDLKPFRTSKPSLLSFRKGRGPILGAVGRLVEQKGFDYLLRAVPGILIQYPDAMLLIVGEGNQRSRLEALARELHITESVVFLGERSDMPNVYASFDIFVLSSIDEGMPMALLEALAAAKPVVATRVAAVPKLVVDDHTGILVESKDAHALQEAVVSLLGDEQKRESLGINGRAWVEQNYSAEVMAQRYLNVYERVRTSRANGFNEVRASA